MSIPFPTKPATATIAVCGEPGVGKTVFLTCIFQSLARAVKDVIVDFDRTTGAGAYFRGIEQKLITDGTTASTAMGSLYPARMDVSPRDSKSAALSIELLDYAGGEFESIVAKPKLLPKEEDQSEQVTNTRRVHETIRSADAYIILLNSKLINPMSFTLEGNPFIPSVNTLIAQLRRERKPVAILFSQADQTPELTDAKIDAMPYVRQFREEWFTDDLDAATKGGRPFGIVRRVTCYETPRDSRRPKRQTTDSIWKSEPADVVLELIRAAMPNIQKGIDAQERADAAAATAASDERTRKHRRQWSLILAAGITVLTIIAALAFFWYTRNSREQVRSLGLIEERLKAGNIEQITDEMENQLAEILDDARKSRAGGPGAIREAIGRVEAALDGAGQQLMSEPRLDARYEKGIARYASLLPRFDSSASAQWRETRLPVLATRRDFVSHWLQNLQKPRREQTLILDSGASRFENDGDRTFSAFLKGYSTDVKNNDIASWYDGIAKESSLQGWFVRIQGKLTSTVDEDPEFVLLARKALAGYVATAVVKRSENDLMREQLLTPLVENLAQFHEGEVRFDVLARELLNCKEVDPCEHGKTVVRSVMDVAVRNRGSWGAQVENLLSGLLKDLPVAQRREVWKAIGESLRSSYFFDTRVDAWPPDLRPFYIVISEAADAKDDPTDALILRFAQGPAYAAELEYLDDRLTAAAMQRHIVPVYAAILETLDQPGIALAADDLTEFRDEIKARMTGRGPTGPLPAIEREIDQVLGLITAVNQARVASGDVVPREEAVLKNLLLQLRRDHCQAFPLQSAPEDCSDAA